VWPQSSQIPTFISEAAGVDDIRKASNAITTNLKNHTRDQARQKDAQIYFLDHSDPGWNPIRLRLVCGLQLPMCERVDEGSMQQRLRNAADMFTEPMPNRTNVDGPEPRTPYRIAGDVLQPS
jgi:hypothetical protein